MMINRNNYEEYFLLLVDNELTETEKRAVERFIQQNPDLASELNMLMQSRLQPDSGIRFEKKEMLLQGGLTDVSFIHEGNYADFLLSYIDDELNIEEKNAIEEYLNRNLEARQELDLLRKTKMEADKSVLFPDKSLLYKTIKTPAKLIITRWRVAAAAAVIVVAGLLWITMQDKKNPELAKELVTDIKENTSTLPVTNDENARIENNTVEEMKAEEKIMETKPNSPILIARSADSKVKEKKKVREAMISADQTLPVKNDQEIAEIARIETNALPEKSITETAKTDIIDKITIPGNTAPVTTREIIERSSLSADVKTDYASEALLKEDYGIEVTLAEEPHAKKGLFRGLVRKANRVFNKVTNPDPGKPMVRVANFEIALAK